MTQTLASSHKDSVRRMFPGAYIVNEKFANVAYEYYVYSGFANSDKDVLLGMGRTEDKAWLDGLLGANMLRKYTGRPEVVFAATKIVRNGKL